MNLRFPGNWICAVKDEETDVFLYTGQLKGLEDVSFDSMSGVVTVTVRHHNVTPMRFKARIVDGRDIYIEDEEE